MKQFILIILAFIAFYSYSQPGAIEGKTIISDSIKFIVIDPKGDTLTSKNIEDKHYRITTVNVRGSDKLSYSHCRESININTPSFDSTGVVIDSHRTEFDIFRSDYDAKVWYGAWIIEIHDKNSTMKVYVDNLDEDFRSLDSPEIFVIYFIPGNYYLLRQPQVYNRDGKTVTHALIPIEESQPESLEEIFEHYHIREKMGIKMRIAKPELY